MLDLLKEIFDVLSGQGATKLHGLKVKELLIRIHNNLYESFPVPTDQLTHSFCFETCTGGITNDAPGADNSVPPNLGSPPNTCDEGNGVNTGSGFASPNQRITITPNIQTSGPKTGAILVKHISGSEGKVPREVLQNNAFAIHSEPFPAARAFVKNGGTSCLFEVDNVYSTTEYVLVVVTVDGTNLKMYK